MTTIALDSISLEVEIIPEESDDDVTNRFGPVFTSVNADVYRKTSSGAMRKIGEISGTSVNRNAIPENGYLMTFDEHSGVMEWVAGTLLENRYGRTQLQSLRDAGDDQEFDFFLMDNFRIDEDQPCDVATFALRKFLHGSGIKGNLNSGCWKVSSIAYVLSEFDSSEKQKTERLDYNTSKRKRDEDFTASTGDRPNYHESIPFLRNGFFRDTALLHKNQDNARILVGAVDHFEKNLKSEDEVRPAVKVLLNGLTSGKPTGKDAEILSRVEAIVNANFEKSERLVMANLSSIMIGKAAAQPARDCTDNQQLQSLRRDLARLVQTGGSIARSTALHVACEKNSIKIAKLLIEMDRGSINVKDRMGQTPLMLAAIKACGRTSITGIDETVLIDHLLASGANKTERNTVGMTAYGLFKKESQMAMQMVSYQYRSKFSDLEQALFPPGGPTAMDVTQGKGGMSGLVDYGPEDDIADRECGRGAYATRDDYGDY